MVCWMCYLELPSISNSNHSLLDINFFKSLTISFLEPFFCFPKELEFGSEGRGGLGGTTSSCALVSIFVSCQLLSCKELKHFSITIEIVLWEM